MEKVDYEKESYNYKIVKISDFHNNQSNTLSNDLIKETQNQMNINWCSYYD